MSVFHRLLLERLLKTADTARIGAIRFITPDGKARILGRNQEELFRNIPTLTLTDWRAVGTWLARGDIGFAETYRDAQWHTDDLYAVLTFIMMNRDVLEPTTTARSLPNLLQQLAYWLRRNSVKGSRRNIHDHYDLGNNFYQLWLDDSMTYSSALYSDAHEEQDLGKAQMAKYDRIIDILNKPQNRLLEVGCGWGGFAAQLYNRGYDGRYKGLTLSTEQKVYADRRLPQAQNDNNFFALEDYRLQEGQYDSIVSIEMFEAVGRQYWPVYFSKLRQLLKDNGKAVIQTITVADDEFKNYARESDFIRSYIFPGGMLPSQNKFEEQATRAGFQVGDVFSFGQDYARTLLTWLKNFDEKTEQIKAQGFDEAFIRLWRFYLAGCAAGFRSGYTNVRQIELNAA